MAHRINSSSSSSSRSSSSSPLLALLDVDDAAAEEDDDDEEEEENSVSPRPLLLRTSSTVGTAIAATAPPSCAKKRQEKTRKDKTICFEFVLCLSRACLGKMMMHFIHKWHRKQWRFSSHLLSEIDKVLGHEASLAALHNPDLPPESVTSQSTTGKRQDKARQGKARQGKAGVLVPVSICSALQHNKTIPGTATHRTLVRGGVVFAHDWCTKR